jgi:glyoxylase-like metal-dependent hydrolase (beta-lactamase superfamily II)
MREFFYLKCMQPFIGSAIASVTDEEITHVVYSHTHQDHIAGAGSLNLTADTVIIGNTYTGEYLREIAVRPPSSQYPTS